MIKDINIILFTVNCTKQHVPGITKVRKYVSGYINLYKCMYPAKSSAPALVYSHALPVKRKKAAKIPKKFSSERGYFKLLRTHMDKDKAFILKMSFVMALNTFKTSP